MANWQLDGAHSEIEFKVRHMMISTVKGQFKNFEVNVQNTNVDLSQGQVEVKIEVDSIDTKNEQRDQHLKSSDFFDVATNQYITFQSTNIAVVDDENLKITGNLTLKKVTKFIIIDEEFGYMVKNQCENNNVGYTINRKMNRANIGLSCNAALETGGVIVSVEMKFKADLHFINTEFPKDFCPV